LFREVGVGRSKWEWR